jgi:hypothetical protein
VATVEEQPQPGRLRLQAEAISRPADLAEMSVLGRELANSYHDLAEYYRDKLEKPPAEASALVRDHPPEYLERARRGDPSGLSWHELSALAQVDVEAAKERWLACKQAARDELTCGVAGAKAVEGFDSTPFERAKYLAIRAELAEEWQPRGGLEWQLLETAAQAQMQYLQWLGAASRMEQVENGRLFKKDGYEEWEAPRLSRAEVTDRAYDMADRWNRVFLRNLRALRDLRRYAPSVHIENHGQVNIGKKQVNVKADAE